MVDWGIVCWQHNCGSVTRAMGAATLRRDTAANADQSSLPRLYSATGTALRRS